MQNPIIDQWSIFVNNRRCFIIVIYNTIIIYTMNFNNNLHIRIPENISTEDIHSFITRISQSIQTEEVIPLKNEKSLCTPLEGIKAVVFDVYGTLIHSAAGDINIDSARHAEYFSVDEIGLHMTHHAVSSLLKNYIMMKHTEIRDTHNIAYPEIDAIQMWRAVSKDKAFPLDALTDTEAALCAVAYEMYNNPSCEMPSAMLVLETLHKRGLVLGIVSNAQFYTPLFLQAIFQKYPLWNTLQFPVQVWSYTMQEAKPSIKLFEHMLEGFAPLNIQANEIIYIGNDKRNDIAPPQSLGIHTMLFAGDTLSYRPRDDDIIMQNIRPDAIITTLQDIPHLI